MMFHYFVLGFFRQVGIFVLPQISVLNAQYDLHHLAHSPSILEAFSLFKLNGCCP